MTFFHNFQIQDASRQRAFRHLKEGSVHKTCGTGTVHKGELILESGPLSGWGRLILLQNFAKYV
jgi:hypothetical protein